MKSSIKDSLTIEQYLQLHPKQIRYLRDFMVYQNYQLVADANNVSYYSVTSSIQRAKKQLKISKTSEIVFKLHIFELEHQISYINNVNINTARASILN